MYSKSLKLTKYQQIIKTFLNKNDEHIIDIFVFGSAIKGKDDPSDIDILFLHKNNKDLKLSYQLITEIKKEGCTPQVTDITYEELLSPALIVREALIESWSARSNQMFSKSLGYQSLTLFTYNLKQLNKSERMRFYYSLHGRNSEGMLKKESLIKLSDNILLCPTENFERTKQYLQSWKIYSTSYPIFIPTRIFSLLSTPS